jgi:hypothetical protein
MIFLSFSCSREEALAPEAISLDSALIQSRWQLRSVSLVDRFGTTTNVTAANFKICELDNYLLFRRGEYLMIEGGTACDQPGLSIFTLLSGQPWAANDSFLVIGTNVDRQFYKVKSWSSRNMKWEQYQKNALGEWETYTYQLLAQ